MARSTALLQSAVKAKNLEAVELLISLGVHPGSFCRDKRSAFQTAVDECALLWRWNERNEKIEKIIACLLPNSTITPEIEEKLMVLPPSIAKAIFAARQAQHPKTPRRFFHRRPWDGFERRLREGPKKARARAPRLSA